MRTHHAIKALVAAVGLGLCTASAHAVTIGQGSLSVTIDNNNGAISNLSFTEEFYQLGTVVSDWGLQVGTDTASFRINTGTGSEGIATTVTAIGPPPLVTASANYNAGGANVDLQRQYEIVTGLDVLSITTTFTNLGGATTLRYFDVYDPDQGPGSATVNDIFTLAGVTVAQASNGPSVVMGIVPPSGGSLAFGGGTSAFGLGIGNGSELNTAFATPFDPNGANADIGMAVLFEINLGVGESVTVNYLQAYGTSAAAASDMFTRAVSTFAVPEPASLALLAASLLGLGAGLRRRR